MLDHLMLDTLRQIAHGLAAQFGSNCEVVVHDLDPDRLDNSIVLIENGHVSHRKQGDGPSHIVLEALKSDPAALKDKLSYLTRTHDNRILKSSTLYIRDEEGKRRHLRLAQAALGERGGGGEGEGLADG